MLHTKGYTDLEWFHYKDLSSTDLNQEESGESFVLAAERPGESRLGDAPEIGFKKGRREG